MRRRTGLGIVAALALLLAGNALAQQAADNPGPSFFRIGTGSTAGTYYPIGGLLAQAISAPPGARACAEPGECGVPGLVASALASTGSVANAEAVQGGALESGFVQGDVAAWAYSGGGIWQDRPKADKLRAIANLYPEAIHLVVRDGAQIESVADLRGKRVSLDEPGSGTLVDARAILAGAGLSERDISPLYLTLDEAGAAMQQGQLDALFFVGGYPAGAIAELASQQPIRILPIDGALAQGLMGEHGFLARATIPAGTYDGQDADVATISVGAQWVTSTDQPEALIHDITRALWSARSRRLLDAGHARGRDIAPDRALQGIGIPLHPGAARYYREAGLLK
ncbi:TAXI family TRAP transporter solute-binding subunit [Paracoccus sp. DMF]|uniref:TAXI family TRAP transporter solute-binding subunit n=1 Tax=Paracoccus sp. DMF TaxID=400837 RepID=UPI0021E379E1|nr:TAXI family TRAP transporter solute-binding subunit [Paracoccus sp. DMF]MCV2446013.1 TAXI family TRAP transporter solute-binding subunit [Paracoccus sp. DMF]